jgi:parallel beta-helix repeat protein
MKTGVIPADGMEILEDTRFAAGVYVLPNGLSLAADGITLEGDNTLILSAEGSGVGIRAQGRKGVTLRGLRLSGYYHGIRCDDCEDVTVENVQVRNTSEIEGIETFLYLWLPIEKVYSGAILLNNVRGGVVRNCDLQHQMNGIVLYGCSNLTIERNNASFNSGWGIYLSATNDSRIADNQLDFCNRLFRRPEDGSVRAEADTAAIVLVKSSSRNQFLRNSCIAGGDGIFVAGYEHPGKVDPCNDNLFEDNDCRLSPNNAIESTFSKGNIFRRNNCSRCNYGFWMGFSWDNTLEDNLVEFNRFVGVAAEHAHDFVMRGNTIRLNGEGVRLWTRGGAVVPYWPGFEVSYNMTLENNTFEGNRLGFAGYTGTETREPEAHDYTLRGNIFRDNRVGAQFTRVHDCVVEDNEFTGNVEAALRLLDQPGVRVENNHFANNAVDQDET